MRNDLPYISIVIPIFNGEKFLDGCLESIINLEYSDFEVVLVDNGSTDKTVEIIRNFQDKYHNINLCFEKRKSSYAARNTGIKNSKGNIIAFTDIDCRVDKKWLINLVHGFSNESIGGVAGEILPDVENNLIERYTAKAGVLSQTKNMSSEFPYAATANVAYRKEVFDHIGFFDDKMISAGDVDFSWRMQLETEYKLSFAEDAIVFHKHRTNMKGLFKQSFRYGYGRAVLNRKYKDKPLIKNNKSAIDNFVAKIKEPYLIVLKYSEGEFLSFALLYFLYICIHRLGRTYAKFILLKEKTNVINIGGIRN